MTSLQEESVSPALAWVKASVLSIMATQLPLLQSATQALLEAGIDASHPTEGDLNLAVYILFSCCICTSLRSKLCIYVVKQCSSVP